MKAIKLLTASALLAGLAALSFAGPSPQFSSAQARKQQAQPAKVATVAAKEVKVCANCACCSMNR
jgi:hypothetical protein